MNDDLGREDLSDAEAMRVELLYTSALHGWETGFLNSIESGTDHAFELPDGVLFGGRFSRETWSGVRSEFNNRFADLVEDRYDLPPKSAP
ncbi:MAG TPA: hypothetical protein VKA63_04700 [Candidatus Krumholzibacteria bacterium]|nr:hypothetical protein [Candidatus Krumholzibacteria bacterium]